ncbi:MAG: winged helix-turn-helix domain-containing protein [Chloroflexi bacterium]|nr:winged helix-turn-helix domain-containing protein [Chloroflexota bacterium]
MNRTVRQLMDEQASWLVGRDEEMALLRRMLGDGGPLIAFIHGIAGVGKSAIAEAFAVQAREQGATVLQLDGRAIQPTPDGFFAALEDKTGGALKNATEGASRLARLAGRVILIVDTYELLRMLDPWFRQTFVPALPDTVRIVLSGREPPMSGWLSDFGGLFRGIAVENLTRSGAEVLLEREGLDAAEADGVYRLARGHPLSLRLAAVALSGRSQVGLEARTVKAVVEGLTELYLGVLDPKTREALDAASVVRRPTLSLLGAMLPDTAPQDAFARLRSLPFVQLGDDGLVVHDTVREAVAALLRSADPERSRRYRAAAWRQLRAEVAVASLSDNWRYTADLLFILQNPIVREAFFPTTDHLYSIEAASSADVPSIRAIADHHLEPALATVVDTWWRLAPYAFRVLRDRGNAVAGFYLICEIDAVSHRLVEADAVMRQCWEHLRSHPVPRGQKVLVNRMWLGAEGGEGPSPAQAASWLDVKRLYMDLRPNLRRIYTMVRDLPTFGPMVAPLGFAPLPGAPASFDGVADYVAMLDFGPSSIDGWLANLVAVELQIDDGSILDLVQHQLVLDGRRIDLTKLEFSVMSYLNQRKGSVVERGDLLRDVWGHDVGGGSNVLEANVKSLRRKLGDRATSIETIRGLGYRFTAPN